MIYYWIFCSFSVKPVRGLEEPVDGLNVMALMKTNQRMIMGNWKKIISVLIISIGILLIIDIGRYFIYPSMTYLKNNRPAKTAFMEYRESAWQREGVNKKITNIWVPLNRISPYAMKAVIIAEDDKFWSHEGFDFEAMQKALEKDIKKKKFKAGGSTISQQLAKNLYLSPSKNPVRKIKEAILTWRMERNLSKRRIMELYLNVAEWGDGVFGIEAAARKHYGKSAAALGPREAAVLASILPNPIKYKPHGSSRYVVNRSERIYQIMVRRGIVIPEYEEVIAEPDESAEQTGEQVDQSTPDVTGQTGEAIQPTEEKKEETVPEEPNVSPVLPETENKTHP